MSGEGETMLGILKKFFPGKTDYPVETYGKLPCYKDYISVIITEGAVQWRTWLLDSFQGKVMPPEGKWHFIYQHRKEADPVVGVIQASSDGLRQFPFSLFTVCNRGSGRRGFCSRPMAVSIWQQLENMYQPLIRVADIQAFYAQLYGKKISALMEKDINLATEFEFSCNREGEWPLMLVAATSDAGVLHLVKDGKTTNEEFVRNWQGLMGIGAYIQTTSSTQGDDMTINLGIE